MSNEPQKPDFYLKVTERQPRGYEGNTRRGTIGAAWWKEGPYGRFLSIQLNPGVVLDWRMNNEYHISLFPPRDYNDEKDE